jgi:archaellum component FlaC
MSIDYIARQIATVDHEINAIEKNIQALDTNINRKSKEANDILIKISREKDLKRIISYQKDLLRKNSSISFQLCPVWLPMM